MSSRLMENDPKRNYIYFSKSYYYPRCRGRRPKEQTVKAQQTCLKKSLPLPRYIRERLRKDNIRRELEQEKVERLKQIVLTEADLLIDFSLYW